ncbi:hypothetical protein VTL71DRAFT_8891 [Oculimacula yallundae]|uniref:Uncharacterized protein n=1 Tax=Oculimacula yallundae TaxID=86028 RepID=A0ABR4BT55_9HELO
MSQLPAYSFPGQISPGAQAAFDYDSLWFWQSSNETYPSLEKAQARGQLPETFLRYTKDKRYVFSVVNGVVHRSRPAPGLGYIVVAKLRSSLLNFLYQLSFLQVIIDFFVVSVAAVVLIPAFGFWYILYEMIYRMVVSAIITAAFAVLLGTCVFLYDVFWSAILGIARIVVVGGVVICAICCILLGQWSISSLHEWTNWAAPAFTGLSYPTWIRRLKRTFTTRPF